MTVIRLKRASRRWKIPSLVPYSHSFRGGQRAQYWLWVDSRLPGRDHEELLEDGTQVEVLARINLQGMTRVFVGVHRPSTHVWGEEFHDRTLDEPQYLNARQAPVQYVSLRLSPTSSALTIT
ncbi:hypothetical protein [Pseudomonas sp. FW300-N2F2]|uniref:hypothetical protein n=1 Tax=Pseudomonas sp. FW300-N2F2 TaxID=2751320 RepID=UPI001A93662F|nr:hypothetical protein [Pseudomonas sp. FW300-N2F2]